MNQKFARIILAGVLIALSSGRVASAQISPIPNSADPNAETGDNVPLKFKGFALNITAQDSTALNLYNYSNQAYVLFEPSWAMGKALFPKSKLFHHLNVAARIPLTYTMAGYDSTAAGGSDLGLLPSGCSGATLNNNASLNTSSVGRCDTSQSRRLTPGDISLFISNPGMYTIPKADVRLSPSLRFNFPASYESRFQTMVMSVQAGLGFGRTFLDHKLSVGYQFGAVKVFNRSSSTEIQTDGDTLTGFISTYSAKDVQPGSDSFYTSGSRITTGGGLNTNFSLSNILSVGYSVTDKLSFSAMYLFSSAFAYSTSDTCGPMVLGGVVTDPCQNADAVANTQAGYNGQGTETQAIRNNQYFMLNASYQLKDWVGLYASWATFSPFRKADNSWRQPFVSVDYNAFSSVNVGATFTMGYEP